MKKILKGILHTLYPLYSLCIWWWALPVLGIPYAGVVIYFVLCGVNVFGLFVLHIIHAIIGIKMFFKTPNEIEQEYKAKYGIVIDKRRIKLKIKEKIADLKKRCNNG